MIVDTSLLIALDQNDSNAIETVQRLEADGIPLRIPTAVIVELYVSVGLGTDPNANAAALEALVANYPVVPLDENIARKAGMILGVHRASDSKPQLGGFDAIVAATGLVRAEPILTNDTDDFGSVDGLAVESW